jgi:hypothetical protein
MAGLRNGRVRHSVVFRLAHAEGSAAQADFLAAIAGLGAIAGFEDFELLREVSPKNDYTAATNTAAPADRVKRLPDLDAGGRRRSS